MIYVLLYLYTICGEFYKKSSILWGFFSIIINSKKHLNGQKMINKSLFDVSFGLKTTF